LKAPKVANEVQGQPNIVPTAQPPSSKAYYQAFFWVLIDLIVELLGLIIKPFDNQTEN
jgi:hypothetical protein